MWYHRGMAKNHLERVMHIDLLIREGSYPSRKTIAERFEVSIKTVERDLDYMRDRLDAPIEYSREHRGFFYAHAGYYLPAVYMNEGDALALFLSHHLGSAWRGTPLASSAERAWTRLSKLLPEEIAISPATFGDHVMLIDRSVPFQAEHWLVLLRAATTSHKVRMEYRAPGYEDSVTRTLHPYRLIHHRDAWYILGFDEFREEVRIYALSRVQAVVLEEDAFTQPPDFDPAEHVDPEFGVFHETEWFTARVLADPGIAEIVAEHVPERGKRVDLQEDGTVVLTFETNQWEELKHWVLQWGEHIEVLEPESMRDELAGVGRYYSRRYRVR